MGVRHIGMVETWSCERDISIHTTLADATEASLPMIRGSPNVKKSLVVVQFESENLMLEMKTVNSRQYERHVGTYFNAIGQGPFRVGGCCVSSDLMARRKTSPKENVSFVPRSSGAKKLP